MKTQLLEDIGQNATVSLAPSGKAGDSTANKTAQTIPPVRSAPLIPETQRPDQASAPPDLDSVFEEIAALEAQYVPPATNHEPVLAPAEPARPASREDSLHAPATIPAEAMPGPDPAHAATVPRDPVFDFTLPTPEPQAATPFTPSPTWPTRTRHRTLLWSAGLLSAALLIGGGWWLYEEHSLGGSLALVANGAKEAPPAPAAPVSSPAPAAAPLVMLEPASSAAKAGQSPAAPAPVEQAEAEATARAEPDAERTSAFPLPKSLGRAARGEDDAAAEPPRRKVKPESVRPVARASAVQAEKPATGEGAMTALLRACREHGYHAAQCVKQGCSLTQYGFACRGR